MRNGVRWSRRVAAGISLSLVTVVAMGTGAGAATTGLDSYSALGSGTTLALSVKLPTALDSILKVAKLSSDISERVSFSNATGQVSKTSSGGSALGRVFQGTLDPLLLDVSRLVGYTGAKLPEAEQRMGTNQKTVAVDMARVDIPAENPMVHVGVAEARAQSNRVGNVVYSTSRSTLLGVRVDLTSVLSNSQIQSLLKPVIDVFDGTGGSSGLINQINAALQPVEDSLNSTLGTKLDLALPKISTLLDKPLVNVGLIESISETGAKGLARTAHGVTRLANVDLLGGFIHADSIVTDAFAQIDGTLATAKATKATQRILGLRVGNNVINLNTNSLEVAGKTIELPTGTVSLFETALADLGFRASIGKRSTLAQPYHARSEASSLHLELAPKVLATGNSALFAVTLDGPTALAEVAGANVLGKTFTPRTGVTDRVFWLAGPALFGLAVLVRRFALSR
jgi:hypothetical protein